MHSYSTVFVLSGCQVLYLDARQLSAGYYVVPLVFLDWGKYAITDIRHETLFQLKVQVWYVRQMEVPPGHDLPREEHSVSYDAAGLQPQYDALRRSISRDTRHGKRCEGAFSIQDKCISDF